MIQAKELRIGNKVNLIALDQIIEIESVNRVDGLTGLYTWINENEEYEDSLTGIEGIPLTPELLVKCGFKWNGDKGSNKHYFLNGLRITVPSYTLSILRDCDKAGESQAGWCGKSIGDRIPLKSLHQLQNLYHSLTQTEITINL